VVSLLPHGGYAEKAAAPAAVTVPLPAGVSYDQAAALPVAYLTAWVALIEFCKLQPGESCLVQACSSGVGMAGVQIAKHVCQAGLVITTAGTDQRAARGKDLGADAWINYNTTDFAAEVMRLTNGRGVDAVLELVGGETFTRSQQVLAEGGRMVSGGRSSGEPAVVDEELAKRKNQQVWSPWGAMGGVSDELRAGALRKILELVADGTLQVVIDRVFPLSETAEAHRHLAKRGQFGKVLLRP
jgi:NADPH2:quinone reductase